MTIRQLNPRNQITLPSTLLSRIGASSGSYFDIYVQGEYIILKPVAITGKEENLIPDEWDRLEDLIERQVKRKEFIEYDTLKRAKQHLKKRFRKDAN